MRTMAFDTPTNVGPTYGMYVGPTLYQRYISNMSYVGAALCQHVGPTMAQRASLRWANVVYQRWANGVANQNTPLAQCYHAIWALVRNRLTEMAAALFSRGRVPANSHVQPLNNPCLCLNRRFCFSREKWPGVIS